MQIIVTIRLIFTMYSFMLHFSIFIIWLAAVAMVALALAWVRATHHTNSWVFGVYCYTIYTFCICIFTLLPDSNNFWFTVDRHAYRDAHALHRQLAMYVLWYDITLGKSFYFWWLLLHLCDVTHPKWICTSDYTVVANVGFYLVDCSLHKITLEHYDGRC